MTVLILGGTAEARALAGLLQEQGVPMISSLAGRVSQPRLPAGPVRIGGFGGVDGLADFLAGRLAGATTGTTPDRATETAAGTTAGTKISAVVDATHPFAATMSRHAAEACRRTGVQLLRLARPGWADHPLASSWTWVPDLESAAAHPAASSRPFLTTGRQSLYAFGGWHDRHALVRLVDPPQEPLPPAWTVLRSRGPYDHDHERELFLRHRVDLLVTKDSGGSHTVAKLEVAAELGVPVVIIARPAAPAGVPEVGTPAQAAAWVTGQVG